MIARLNFWYQGLKSYVFRNALISMISLLNLGMNSLWYILLYIFQLFHPRERLENPTAQSLIFDQIVQDVYNPGCMRVSKDDRIKMRGMLGKSLVEFIHIYTAAISADGPPSKWLAEGCDTSCKNIVFQEDILSKDICVFFINPAKQYHK
jgi:hypothetical protein